MHRHMIILTSSPKIINNLKKMFWVPILIFLKFPKIRIFEWILYQRKKLGWAYILNHPVYTYVTFGLFFPNPITTAFVLYNNMFHLCVFMVHTSMYFVYRGLWSIFAAEYITAIWRPQLTPSYTIWDYSLPKS